MLHLAVKISSHADTETPAAQPGPVCLHQSSHHQQFPGKQEHCELKARGYKNYSIKVQDSGNLFFQASVGKKAPQATLSFLMYIFRVQVCV